MGFLFDGINRHEEARQVEEAGANAAVSRQGQGCHHHKGKRVGIAQNTSNLLHLNTALELQREIMLHCPDLHKDLVRLLRQWVFERGWGFTPRP